MRKFNLLEREARGGDVRSHAASPRAFPLSSKIGYLMESPMFCSSLAAQTTIALLLRTPEDLEGLSTFREALRRDRRPVLRQRPVDTERPVLRGAQGAVGLAHPDVDHPTPFL